MKEVFNKIFLWLGIGLIISFVMGYYLSNNIEILETYVYGIGLLPITIATLVIAFLFKLLLLKLPTPIMYVLYILFSSLIGFTIASIFIYYELSSIISMLMLTAIIFMAMALYGYLTKKDLLSFGKMLMFGLLIVIIFSVINIFIGNETFEVIITAVSALIFVGFIGYDIQKIKSMYNEIDDSKLVIYGAFELYLDFINLFLDLIRLFGKQK